MARVTTTKVVNPEGWPRPRGYANGVVGRGQTLHVAGQIAWEPDGSWVAIDFVDQFRRALQHVVAVVEAAGGEVTDLARLTIYVTDIGAYRQHHRDVGVAYRAVLGKHFPAMALVAVSDLVEPKALVEIEATAYLDPSAHP
ncbi:MAG: RidA family protein [Myxococcota bacterium]